MSFSGIVPAPIPGATIKELSLNLRTELYYFYADHFVAMQDLLAFLQETPSLEILKVISDSLGSSKVHPILDFPTATLESLRDLTFILGHNSIISDTDVSFTLLTDCLHLPNLSSLCVKIGLMDTSDVTVQDITNIINDFVPRHGYTTLKNLFLYVFDHNPKGMHTMNVALDKYSSLETLTVGITGHLVVAPGSTLHPDLKSRGSLAEITLLACTRGAEDFLAWAVGELRVGELRDGGGLEKLKKVVVNQCASVTESDISKILSLDKVEYIGTKAGGMSDSFSRSIGYEFYHDNLED